MWFRNLRLYRFTEPFDLSPEALESRLTQLAFRPCSRLEPMSYGFVPPVGDNGPALVHVTDGRIMIRARKEEKIVPGGVIKQMVAERAREIEVREGRQVRRKERETLREELMLELLPKALARRQEVAAYIDPDAGWLVVDAASGKKADELTSALRRCLERLPIRALMVADSPSAVMTSWLAEGEIPSDVLSGEECELRDPSEEGAVVRVKKQDLAAEEVLGHFKAGKRVTRLAITWDGRIECLLAEDMAVRRLRFTDVVKEALEDLPIEDEIMAFDADFAILGAELGRFLPRLVELFGGESGEVAAP